MILRIKRINAGKMLDTVLTNSVSSLRDNNHYYGNYGKDQKAYNVVIMWRQREADPERERNLRKPLGDCGYRLSRAFFR